MCPVVFQPADENDQAREILYNQWYFSSFVGSFRLPEAALYILTCAVFPRSSAEKPHTNDR
jgi:hypothetical protein